MRDLQKLDEVAWLVADPPPCHSTTRQHLHNPEKLQELSGTRETLPGPLVSKNIHCQQVLHGPQEKEMRPVTKKRSPLTRIDSWYRETKDNKFSSTTRKCSMAPRTCSLPPRKCFVALKNTCLHLESACLHPGNTPWHNGNNPLQPGNLY